jgi:putative ABC transport system substrate-binding protein
MRVFLPESQFANSFSASLISPSSTTSEAAHLLGTAAARLPTVHENRDQVEAGGLMSYAANFTEQYQRAADYVDKILRGAKPADLPVQQPTKFEFVINLRTATALSLDIPVKLLAFADEVIE